MTLRFSLALEDFLAVALALHAVVNWLVRFGSDWLEC